MGENEIFNKVLINDIHFVLRCNESETIIYQEYFQPITLNEQQIKDIHGLLSCRMHVAYFLKVNGGGLIPYEDETWVEKLGLSDLIDAGILFIAYISPNNIFSNLEIEREIMTDATNKIKIRIFKDSEGAIAWLKSYHIF